jgi:6-pyruvoyltetrahydropterin/6-carboxytetrahydropterin synthase
MYTIIKKLGPFAASHQLVGMPDGHQCGRKHGHNYEVEVEISSDELNEHGFVVDYGGLNPLAEYLTSRMDHRDLNEQFSFNPTAENLARHIFEWVAGTQAWPVVAVRVSETPGKTVSEFRADLPSRIVVCEEHSRTVVQFRGARSDDFIFSLQELLSDSIL